MVPYVAFTLGINNQKTPEVVTSIPNLIDDNLEKSDKSRNAYTL
jgi:hypothetical protein